MIKLIIKILSFLAFISANTLLEFDARERVRNDIRFRADSSLRINYNYNEEELVEFIQTIMNTYSIPGLSISIVKDENIVWEKYLGYGNISDEIFVDENTMFILSSVSKTLTATALMQLFESGSFELDDDIDDYLSFNVNSPNYPFIPITFKMLLSHTSGIKDNWNVMPYYDGDSPYDLDNYLFEYLNPEGQFYNSSLNFTNSIPGTNYSYSNIAVALIGLLVEEISNQPFNEYCKENIFNPLEMDNTFWFLSEIENIDQVALPYSLSGGSGNTCYEIGCGIYDESNPCFCDPACIDYNDCCFDYIAICGENGTGSNGFELQQQYHYGYSDYPSGQLRTTSKNLAKLTSAYLNDGVYNGIRILDQETIELIKTIQYPNIASDQGLIWYYKNQNGRSLFGHNGGDLGSLTEMFISFSDNIGVVLLSNTTNYNGIIEIEEAVLNFAEYTNFIIIGDINIDSLVNIQDVILAIEFILNDSYNNLADINSDDIIDILDIILLVDIVLN